ncbi:MAG: hypothetical protein ISP24_03280 [Rickettsiales bacterium]|nr:hypothetical protein [Rickettsiales bacterium]
MLRKTRKKLKIFFLLFLIIISVIFTVYFAITTIEKKILKEIDKKFTSIFPGSSLNYQDFNKTGLFFIKNISINHIIIEHKNYKIESDKLNVDLLNNKAKNINISSPIILFRQNSLPAASLSSKKNINIEIVEEEERNLKNIIVKIPEPILFKNNIENYIINHNAPDLRLSLINNQLKNLSYNASKILFISEGEAQKKPIYEVNDLFININKNGKNTLYEIKISQKNLAPELKKQNTSLTTNWEHIKKQTENIVKINNLLINNHMVNFELSGEISKNNNSLFPKGDLELKIANYPLLLDGFIENIKLQAKNNSQLKTLFKTTLLKDGAKPKLTRFIKKINKDETENINFNIKFSPNFFVKINNIDIKQLQKLAKESFK